MEFAKRIGGQPYLAVKFVGKRMDFLFLEVPDGLTQSSGDSYRVNFNDLRENGIDFLTLIKEKEI